MEVSRVGVVFFSFLVFLCSIGNVSAEARVDSTQAVAPGFDAFPAAPSAGGSALEIEIVSSDLMLQVTKERREYCEGRAMEQQAICDETEDLKQWICCGTIVSAQFAECVGNHDSAVDIWYWYYENCESSGAI